MADGYPPLTSFRRHPLLLLLIRDCGFLNQSLPAAALRLCFGGTMSGRRMRSFFILYANDVRFIPKRAAAPPSPPITQLLASSARRIWSLSTSARPLIGALDPL